MPGCCPRCERPLTGDGYLRYCDRCAYEPPESAALPVTPPSVEEADDVEHSPAPAKAERQTSGRDR